MQIKQYEPSYGNEELEAIQQLFKEKSWLSDFEKTKQFEQDLCKFTGIKYCSAVNNGTIAISLALMACGIQKNYNVIVPNLTMIADATAVEFIGAYPVFCDVESETGCLDLEKAKDLIVKYEISAVIYVTLNGRLNPKLKEFYEYCKDDGIKVIKDDAQSLGSRDIFKNGFNHKEYADIHTVSFSPFKVISCGQGGGVFTDDHILAEKIERLKDFGRLTGGEDIHDHFGINSKFTEIQAVIGIEQLKKTWFKLITKFSLYHAYYENLKDNENIVMFEDGKYTPWMIDIYLPTERLRDGLVEYLKDNGIGTRKMYPPIHQQKIYSHFGCQDGDFPISIKLSKTGLWLPSSINLTYRQIEEICNIINGYLF